MKQLTGGFQAAIEYYQEHGFLVLERCLSLATVNHFSNLIEAVRQQGSTNESVQNASGVYAFRNLIDVVPEIVELIHLEFAAEDLPFPLEWHYRILLSG